MATSCSKYVPSIREVRKRASRGEKILGQLFPSRGSGFPGGWSQDRLEQVFHLRNWTAIAIDAICSLVAQLVPNIAYVSDGTLKEGKHRHQEKWLDHDRNGIGQGNGYLQLAPAHTGNGSLYRNIGASKHNGWDVSVTLEKEYQNLPYVPANPNVFQFGGYQRKALSQVKPHEEVEPVEYDHPARRLIENPNPWDTWFDFSYERQMFLELCGVNYTWAVPNDYGIPCELWCIPAHWVWPRTGGAKYVPPDNPHADELVQYYEVRPWGGMGSAGIIKIPPNEIIMEYWKSPINKIDGYSKLSAQAMAIDLEESIEKCNWSQMQNQALPTSFIELPPDFEDPDDARAKRLQARFMDHLQGEYNTGKPFVGSAGMKMTPLSFSPEQMMYGQTKEAIRDQILSAFRVPGAAVGLVKDLTYGSVLATLASFCLDNKTECLTIDGWKKYHELTEDTKVACYDKDKDSIVYRNPSRIISFRHQGPMHRWEGNSLDILATPDHRMLIESNGIWKVKRMREISQGGNYRIRTAAGAMCNAPAKIGVDRYRKMRKIKGDRGRFVKTKLPKKPVGTHQIDSDVWLKFLGYYVSEGSLPNVGKKARRVTISQAYGSPAFKEIERTLRAMPYKWKTYDSNTGRVCHWYVADQGLREHLARHCGKGSRNKKLPRYVMGWPSASLRILLDAAVAGDGKVDRVKVGKKLLKMRYNTVSKQLADDIQEIGVKCGLRISMRMQPGHGKWSDMYSVLLHEDNEKVVAGANRSIVDYDGIVWCVTVPTGFFVVRRNNCAHITGNCQGAIDPRLTMLGQKWTKDLMSKFQRGDRFRDNKRMIRLWYDSCVPHDPQQINADISQDYQCQAISPNEIRALRGRKPWPYGGDNPMAQGPGGLQPLPWNKKEELDKDVADLLGYYHQHASGQQAQQEAQQQAQQQQQGQQGGMGQGMGLQPGQSLEEMAEPGQEGQPQDMSAGIAEPNGPPTKQLRNWVHKDQDDKCWICGRAFRNGKKYLVRVKGESTTVFVGPDCYKKVMESGSKGYAGPLGGGRCVPKSLDNKPKVIVIQKSESGPKTAAIDFDGTILEYNGWHGENDFGKVRPGCIEALSELKRQGWRIIIFTTRGNTDGVSEYLEANGVPFDHVNENPDQPAGSSGKVIADVYVDDRAVNAETDWSTILRNVLGRTYKAKKQVSKKTGPFKYQNTQIDLPGDLGVAARRWVSGHIPEEALLQVEEQSHLTVRYGLKETTNGKAK